jgi:tetratricopeptide (TPR) repeat protein
MRLERNIVRLARELRLRPDEVPELSADLTARATLACEYARRWAEGSALPRLEPQLLEKVAAPELRSLGLLAYLCGDTDTALQAWSQMDLVADPDPLVEASLGQLYLLQDQPARAYPRLRAAFRAFPEAGFLCVTLADAALQCGDFAKAETLLRQARGMERLDPTAGLERVEADLYAATGRDDLAIAMWTTESNAQAVAQFHYGQYLEAHGDLAEATRAYGYAGGIGSHRRAWDGFQRVAPRWWGGLTDEERWRALRESLDHPTRSGWNSVVVSLWNYAEYVLLPLRNEGRAVAAETGSLEAVALGLRAPGRKGALMRTYCYPPWLKDLHATVLLSPWPVHGSLALAALDAVGRRLDLPYWRGVESPELIGGR